VEGEKCSIRQKTTLFAENKEGEKVKDSEDIWKELSKRLNRFLLKGNDKDK